MIDDRDFSWLGGRPAAAPSATPEHVLWALEKAGGRAEMRVRVHPFGHELIMLVDRGYGLSLLWSAPARAWTSAPWSTTGGPPGWRGAGWIVR